MKRFRSISKIGIIAIALISSVSLLFYGCSSAVSSSISTEYQEVNETNTNSIRKFATASEPIEKSKAAEIDKLMGSLVEDSSSTTEIDPTPIPTATPSPTSTPIPSPTPTPIPTPVPEPDPEPEYEPEPEYYYEEPDYYYEEPEPEEDYYYETEPEYYYEPEPEDTEEMVWVSRTGECYHNNPNCSNMKNPDYMTLSEAEDLGRRPCKKCYG